MALGMVIIPVIAGLRCCISVQYSLFNCLNFYWNYSFTVLAKLNTEIGYDPFTVSPSLWLFLIGSALDEMKTFSCLWIFNWLKHCVAFKNLSQRWITELLLLLPILVSIGLLSVWSPKYIVNKSWTFKGTEVSHLDVRGMCTGAKFFS